MACLKYNLYIGIRFNLVLWLQKAHFGIEVATKFFPVVLPKGVTLTKDNLAKQN